MLGATRGKYLCEKISREKIMASGIIIPDSEDKKTDNIGKCIAGVYKNCYIHFKPWHEGTFRYEGKDYLSVPKKEIMAIEYADGTIVAPGSLVIVRLQYADSSGKIIIPDSVKASKGDFTGEVISVGPDYPDKNLKIGDHIIFLRSEGYKFRSFENRQEYLSIKECWIYGIDKRQ